ncbi:MAG: hypothetical protein N3A69_01030, partial [Leptospiraceae bacterium]|nr:hypothetical protein [Leptospiraceae bacterium]
MNLLKKTDGIEIYFYDEDDSKDSTSLRVALEEFLDYFQNSPVSVKFLDLSTIRLESLSVLLSFTKNLKMKGNTCTWICPESLKKQLEDLGLGEFVQLK